MMAASQFDVIVSDMRMPGMDGAALLAQVQQQYPKTVCILLSGQAEQESIIKAIGKTHQYLSKPCSPDLLKNTVARACALKDLLSDEHLLKIAAQMDHMPSVPDIYLALVNELKKEYPSIKDVSKLVSQDVAMTAKILQLVNSAFFGIRRRVTTVDMAVNFLGLEILSSLVLAANVFSQFDSSRSVKGFSMDSLWSHSGQVGRSAQKIVKIEDKSKDDVDEAMTAGLLHDCGKLIFVSNMPDKYAEVLRLKESEHLSLVAAEEEVIGTSHAIIGAYLLGVWGLPDSIVEAVAFHHRPEICPAPECSALTAVHVADAVVQNDESNAAIDMNYLTECGLAANLQTWTASILS